VKAAGAGEGIVLRCHRESRSLTLLLIPALACLAYLATPAQSQDSPSKSSDTKVVTLPVTVRDKHGEIVRNLSKDDFVLEEDGQPRTIEYFSPGANLPLTLGLLVDTSMSQRNVLDEERKASKSFLDQMLTESKDKAFLIHFDREVELLQDVTASREKVQSALELLKTAQYQRESSDDNGGASPDSRPGTGRARGLRGRLLYDTIFLASDELTKKQEGRKALVIVSDGVDRGSKTSLEKAIEAAQRSDTMVYAILSADSHEQEGGGYEYPRSGGGTGQPGGRWPGGGWPGGGGGWPGGGRPGGGRRGGGQRPSQEAKVDGKKILERISKETGGHLYEVSKKEPFDKVYASIAEELHAQYSMGYTPSKDGSVAGYHKIKLEPKNKALLVQTREGYYAAR
jgi:VWFA-related protein